MSRILANIPDVEGPSSNYPKGRILDQDNTQNPPVPGTPIIEALYGDIIQFFKKLIGNAVITENNLPDNETNGYQYVEAFETIVGDTVDAEATLRSGADGTLQGEIDDLNFNAWQNLTLVNSWIGGNLQYRKNNKGIVYLRSTSQIGGGTGIIATLPSGYRPPYETDFIINSQSSSYNIPHVLRLSTNGDIELFACLPNSLYSSFSVFSLNFFIA
ncbi:MAG: hypothetical protein PHW73_00935 [Atribacterota bacterium]|nr:hypothetical protein [Atribacterota bacterium]